MATARDEQQPYEGGGGGGAGGKFRKRPFRRSVHATPYDRPPPNPASLAYRNPNGGGGGWLSKIVDPAQRLIASGAHRLFSSVFRKRLPPPEPPLSLPETISETLNSLQSAVATDFHGSQKESIDRGGEPSYSASGGELTDLEQVLKQKTFTRSEIDRLTALLHSRSVDVAIDDKGKRPELVPLKQVASTSSEEGLPRTPATKFRMESETFHKTPASENRIENQLVSTPVVNSAVREGGAASPTELVELAKSYMHKKPTSPSMLGFRNQATAENSTAMYTRDLNSPSTLPFTPLVPRLTSRHADARENGFLTPRSRGRSAIYSMARTPYSRIHPTNASKGVENAIDIYCGASSSQNAPGALKHRSSVLESDIGSFGPIRRIRQKPNLLISRGLSLPVSEGCQNPSSSRLKPMSLGEPLHHTIKPSAEDGDNNMPNTTVPSKSSEMASKILQQLDKLVSPKDKLSEPKVHALMDKSPGKLSPSMLRGQALKSLEHVDSSKFLGDVHNKLIDGSPSKIAANAQASTSQEQASIKENGPLKLGSAHYKFTSKVNGSVMPKENGEDSTLSKKDAVLETNFPASVNPVAYPPLKKRAFQMSAPEDFVDLDEDSLPNGTASDSLLEGRRKMNFSVAESKNTATEYVKLEKVSGSTEVKPVATEKLNWKTDLGTSTGSMTDEKSTNLVFQNTFSPSTTVLPSVINTESSVSPPSFNFGGKIVSAKDTNAAAPTVNFGFKTAEKAPESQVTFSAPSSLTFGSSDSKLETSSNIPKITAGATDSLPKLPEPDKVDNGKSAVFSRISGTVSPSAVSTSSANVSFSSTPTSNNVSLMNGSATSTPSTPLVFSTLTSQNSSGSASTTFTLASTAGSLASTNSTTLVPAASVFKFESSTSSTTGAPVSKTSSEPVAPGFNFGPAASAVTQVSETSPAPAAPVFNFASTASAPASETSSAPAPTLFAPVSGTSNASSEATKRKQDVSFGNLNAQPTSSASSTGTLFGFTASATSTSANQSQGSIFGVGSVSALTAQASPAGTGVATLTQNVPVQFASSASSQTFGLAGTTTSASGSTPFDSTLYAKPLSSVVTPGLGSTSSEANSISSSGSSTSSVLGSTWQQPKSPVFSFSSSPSTGFSFAASSTPSAATNSSPSTGFSFGAASSSIAAPNSSPSTGFSFGASTGSAAAPSSSPSTGFSFGASSTPSVAANSSQSAGFSFGSSTPSVATNNAPSIGFSFSASSASTASTSPSPFGVSAPTAMNGAQVAFGSNGTASSSSLFTFNSSSTTAPTQQPVFGNPGPGFAFGVTPTNNDQMSMEDSMAEDTVQASAPAASIFGQPQPISQSPPGFTFGSTPAASSAPMVGNPFQFGGQPNLVNPQNPSPFQSSGSLGSNFSMGSGGSGVDKSNRKFVKVKHKQRKK